MRQPLVLIPSQLCNHRVWSYQITHLRDLAEVLVADHRRHDSMAAIAADVLAQAPVRFNLAAHAMGGFVAFEMLRQAPERITRLALFSTFATADGPTQRQRRQGYAQLVRQGHFERVVEERIPILFHPERQEDVELLNIARRMALETGPEGFLRQQKAILDRVDSTATLASITCPTLVVTGRQDAICPPEAAQRLAERIPPARLVIIEDCGHLCPLEQPLQVCELLRDWLTA
jgi:pimeloyl-ACP methyl ester carboxylesterase